MTQNLCPRSSRRSWKTLFDSSSLRFAQCRCAHSANYIANMIYHFHCLTISARYLFKESIEICNLKLPAKSCVVLGRKRKHKTKSFYNKTGLVVEMQGETFKIGLIWVQFQPPQVCDCILLGGLQSALKKFSCLVLLTIMLKAAQISQSSFNNKSELLWTDTVL